MDIGEMQRRLSLKASREPDHRFDDLFSLITRRDWLLQAHDHVASNAGSETAGCDGITMTVFDEDLESHLQAIQEDLKGGKFRPHPVRRVRIPKANGKTRPLGIPSVRDRIVQEALRMALEPIFEADFCQDSYGFRPNRCTMDAIQHLRAHMQENQKYFWIVEGDISSYFDTINHRKLMKLLKRRVADRNVLDLIRNFLRSGVMERKLFKDTPTGTPQGGIISPLLANNYLHELDKYMVEYTGTSTTEKKRRRKSGLGNFIYARYADDFVVLCNGPKGDALAIRDELHSFLTTSLHLKLSLEKTKVTHLNEGFTFLGFLLKRGKSAKKAGAMTTRVLIPPAKAKGHLNALKAIFAPSTHEDSFSIKILAANRVIRGWCQYYQYTSAPSQTFGKLANRTFWLAAHWLGRKHQCTMPKVLRKYGRNGTISDEMVTLLRHTEIKHKRFLIRPKPFPNPYIQGRIERESLPDENPEMGTETRKGSYDRRLKIMQRDQFTCQWPGCGKKVTHKTGEVDHKRARCVFGWMPDADKEDNLWTLCHEHHEIKTRNDRELESRVRRKPHARFGGGGDETGHQQPVSRP